jgi:hypothetical protein
MKTFLIKYRFAGRDNQNEIDAENEAEARTLFMEKKERLRRGTAIPSPVIESVSEVKPRQ